MKTFRNILVGIDFSPASCAALKAAMRLAAYDDASITAVQILEPHLAESIQKVHGFSDLQLQANMEDTLMRFFNESGISSKTLLLRLKVGRPFEELMASCAETKADLLVLGTRGNEHKINQIGSVASKCLRKAPADVLLVREDLAHPFKHAMVCVDFSETAALAVSRAGHVAECEGTKLECVFVYQTPVIFGVDYNGFLPSLPVTGDFDAEAGQKELEEFVTPLLKPYFNLNWQCEVHQSPGVRDDLIRHAHYTKCDLVVLGTHSQTNFEKFFLGSTAESIIREAPCSVLAVKPLANAIEPSEE